MIKFRGAVSCAIFLPVPTPPVSAINIQSTSEWRSIFAFVRSKVIFSQVNKACFVSDSTLYKKLFILLEVINCS